MSASVSFKFIAELSKRVKMQETLSFRWFARVFPRYKMYSVPITLKVTKNPRHFAELTNSACNPLFRLTRQEIRVFFKDFEYAELERKDKRSDLEC